jgi:hypothetical protein
MRRRKLDCGLCARRCIDQVHRQVEEEHARDTSPLAQAPKLPLVGDNFRDDRWVDGMLLERHIGITAAKVPPHRANESCPTSHSARS